MRLLLIAAALSVLLLAISGAAAQTAVPAPTNLQVVSATENSITLAWGPSMVSDFGAYVASKKNQVLVAWTPSQDTRGTVTYNVTKNGTLVSSGKSTPEYLVTGLNPNVDQFRICVTPVSPAGPGPVNCSTFARS